MGQITFKVDADTGKAVQGFLKLMDAQRKVTGESRKHGKASKESGNQILGDIKGMVMGYLSVQGVIQGVTKAVQMLREEHEKALAASKAAAVSMTQAISGAGLLGRGPEMARFMRGLDPAFSEPQAAALFTSVAGGFRPDEARPGSVERFKALMGVAAMGKRQGVADLNQFGMVLGELGQAAPGKSAGDIGDIATLITEASGRYGGKLNRGGIKVLGQAIASGMDPDQAVGLMLASFTAGQGPEAATAFLQKLTTPEAALRPGQRPTAAQSARRRLAGMDMAGQMAALRADPSMAAAIFGESQAPAVMAMLGQDPAAMARAVAAAQAGDLQVGRVGQAAAIPGFEGAMDIEAGKAAAERAYSGDTGAMRAEAYGKGYEAVLKNRGDDAFTRAIRGKLYSLLTEVLEVPPTVAIPMLEETQYGLFFGDKGTTVLREIRDELKKSRGVPSPATHREP